MKKVMIYLASLCVAAMTLSCEKAVELNQPNEEAVVPQISTITCAFPSMTDQNGTKVSLATTGKTQWEVGDKIVIYGNPSSSDASKRIVHEIAAGEIVNPEVAVFDVDFSGLDAQYNSGTEGTYYPYTVAYPYTEGEKYYLSTGNNNYGRSRFENTNQILMAGHVSDDNSSIVLNHLTAAISFSVTGDFDSYTFSGAAGTEVVGYSTFVVEMNRRSLGEGKYRQKYNDGGTTGPLTVIQGSVNASGTNYIFLPVNADREGSSPSYTYDLTSQRYADVVYLPNGFTIKLFKGGNLKKYITSTAPLVITPGHMINLGELPAAALHDYVAPTVHDNTIEVDVNAAYDLSASATANCYLLDSSTEVAANKAYKFKAAKGKGGDVLTNIGGDEDKDVVVLWETVNTDTAPGVGSIISAVDYDQQDGKDAYIVFKMPSTITPGNAVIAAKNAAGDILWSWHIWVPSTSVGTATYDSDKFMDRNLGALKVAGTGDVTSIGLMYQWGRKDPFVSRGVMGSSSRAAVAGTSQSVSSTEMTYDEAVANPTKFSVAANGSKYHWIDTYDYSLWGATKTVNDPCPPGWRVPHRDENSLFTTDLGSTYVYDSGNACVTIGTLVFPCNGRVYYTSGDLSDRGNMYIWTSKCSDNGLARWVRATSSACKYADERAACAVGVRCIAEATE